MYHSNLKGGGGKEFWCSHHVLNVFSMCSHQIHNSSPMTAPILFPKFSCIPQPLFPTAPHFYPIILKGQEFVCFGFWCSHHVLNVFPNSSQWCSQFVAQVLMCSPSCSQQHHTLSYIIIPCPKFYPLTKIAKPRGKRLHTLPIWGVSIVRVFFLGDGPIIWAHHPQQNQVMVFLKEPMFHLPVLWIFLLKQLENHNYIPK
jgi:hypothetical protein